MSTKPRVTLISMDDRTTQLAQLFRAMANLLATRRANPYRIRAYRKAADSILDHFRRSRRPRSTDTNSRPSLELDVIWRKR